MRTCFDTVFSGGSHEKHEASLSLSLVSLLLLTACGGQSTEPVGKADTDTPQIEQPEQPDTTPDEAETPNETDAEGAPVQETEDGDYLGQFPPLPEAEWDYEVVEAPIGIKIVALCDTLTKDDLMDHAQVLKEAGFTSGMEEYPDGDVPYLYSFQAENADGSQLVRLRLLENQQTEVLMWIYN